MELKLEQFLNHPGTIFDVRSPGEFAQGRIPGSINLPIFSNSERAIVGTAYKQVGKEHAIELGLKIVGPKLADFVTQVKQCLNNSADPIAKVHCWRGGLRSQSMAWLLHTAGIKTVMLKYGYKAFRRYALQTLEFSSSHTTPKFLILGGLTGSGKTSILHALRECGEQVLDLEGLAGHRGSSFGLIGLPPQQSVEQFENEIAIKLQEFDSNRSIWIEDESRMIGTCKIPDALFQKMRSSPVFFIEKPLQERIDRLNQEYGSITKEQLLEATSRLSRKLGGVKMKEILQLIENEQVYEVVKILLEYYDSNYLYGIAKGKKSVQVLSKEGYSSKQWAILLQESCKS